MHSSGFEFNKEKMFLRFNGLIVKIMEKAVEPKTTKKKRFKIKSSAWYLLVSLGKKGSFGPTMMCNFILGMTKKQLGAREIRA